jgi:enoyl-CoA hydratase
MSDSLLLEINDGIALVTLNRPDKLNALNFALIDRLMAALDAIETDDAVRAVILTGAGERAFSAGADIHEFQVSVRRGPNAAIRDFVRRGQAMTARLEAFRKPVIAAVNGLAFGGGCEITEAVHLAIASEHARFAKPEINLGMPPTFGGTQRLPRLVGRKRGLELLLTGDPFTAARALEIGLVNMVEPHERLLVAARELAGRIIRHSPLAVGSVITAVTRGLNMGIAEGLQVESEQFAALVPSSDLGEGIAAWIERRPPLYRGR